MAGPLLPSWNLVRVHATWVTPDGTAKIPGSYTVSVPGRLTNSSDDAIIPAGTFISGNLNTDISTTANPNHDPEDPDSPATILAHKSLDIYVPATDDPEIEQDGWKLTIRVSLTGQAAVVETYVIDVPVALTDDPDGINLRTIALSQSIAPQVALYGIGIPGGLAKLSTDGESVVDAFGNPIVGSDSGPGIESLDVVDGNLVLTLTSGDPLSVALPSGEPGEPGEPGSIDDIPRYTSLAAIQTDITNNVLNDGDFLFLETTD